MGRQLQSDKEMNQKKVYKNLLPKDNHLTCSKKELPVGSRQHSTYAFTSLNFEIFVQVYLWICDLYESA